MFFKHKLVFRLLTIRFGSVIGGIIWSWTVFIIKTGQLIIKNQDILSKLNHLLSKIVLYYQKHEYTVNNTRGVYIYRGHFPPINLSQVPAATRHNLPEPGRPRPNKSLFLLIKPPGFSTIAAIGHGTPAAAPVAARIEE